MQVSPFKKILYRLVMCGLLLSSLLSLAACSTGAWWQGKPITQMTPAEQEEQDPMFWPVWEERRGLGE